MVTVEYVCEDGTPFPVDFETEADAAVTWRLDREHTPRPLTPLGESLQRLGDDGGLRVYEEVGMVRPAGFRPGPRANGFAYYSEEPMSDEDLAVMFAGGRALVEAHGDALGIWRSRCLPEVVAACEQLAAAGPDVSLATAAELQAYCLQMTMIPAFVGGHDIQQLAAVCAELHGDEAHLVAHELAQGHDNSTLRADHELWALGRMAGRSPMVSAALSSHDAATAMAELRAGAREAAFFDALDRFLTEFGGRAEGWDIAEPTWREQRDGFWAQLRHLSGADATDPADAVTAGARRRARRTAEIEAGLTADAEALARFRRRLERVSPYVAVREERAHWQLVSVGALRGLVLRRGAELAAAGALEHADDILFLVPEEIEGNGGGSGDLRSAVAERREIHAGWLCRSAPDTIGGSRDPVARAGADPHRGVLRGVGAARGTVTGRARVVTTLEAADRLSVGDVLVCVTTSPPWTPLFGIVAAVVADGGDIGSHVAIAAREYGIPCVVGTGSGTTVIADGAFVTVDGATGTVVFPSGLNG